MNTVLLVEDDWGLVSHWQALLEQEGHRVIHESSVRSAINVLDDTKVDLVITDILIEPEKDPVSIQGGLEIISYIALNLNPLPAIIAISGAVGQSEFVDRNFDRLDAMRALRKPISDVDFLQAVRASLSQKEGSTDDPVEAQARLNQDVNSLQASEIASGQSQQSTQQALELLKATQFNLLKSQFSMDHAPDGIVWLNPDSRILYANKWFCSFLGYSFEEALSLTVADINPRVPDVGFFKENIWPRISSEEYKAEEMHQRKDGKLVPVEVTARLLEFGGEKIICAYVRDIADQIAKKKQAELLSREELAKANNSLEAMVQLLGTSDGVWSWQVGKKEAKFAPGFRKILGFGQDDTESFPETLEAFESRIHAEDLDEMWSSITESYDTKSDFVHELRLLNADGQYIWIRSRGAVSFDDCGNPAHLVGSIYDISEVKSAEFELERQSQALARSNADLSSFAYVASHDLQEPLRAVSGFLQLLENKYALQLDEQGRGYIKKSVDGAARMSQLINDLLLYSHVTRVESEFELVDLGNVVGEALKELERAILNSEAVIEFENLPAIKGARPLLIQLFRNLIGNAIKYRSEAAPKISISSNTAKDWCTIRVQDNGIGISREYHAQVFELFKRLHRREEHSGTGIGLAVCKRVVERHGGTIAVEPNNDAGTCFAIRLPLKNEDNRN